jgi:hypothetical protein
MINIRVLCESDYDVLCSWYREWGWQEVPLRDFLPDNGKGGLMLFDNDRPVCGGFYYTTNSGVGWLAWIVSDKNYKGLRFKAVTFLVEAMIEVLKGLGCKYVYTITDNRVLHKIFDNGGFVQGGKVIEMIKKL